MENKGNRERCAFFDLGPEFNDSKCLNLCELHLILADQLRLTSKRNEDNRGILRNSFEYANRFAGIKSRSSIVDVRTNLERTGVLEEYEIALLVNLLPVTISEARFLIPSLIRIPDKTLNAILEHLMSYKTFTV